MTCRSNDWCWNHRVVRAPKRAGLSAPANAIGRADPVAIFENEPARRGHNGQMVVSRMYGMLLLVAALGAVGCGGNATSAAEPSTVAALDLATGQNRWVAHPPMAYPTPTRDANGYVTLTGSVSSAPCIYTGMTATLDSNSGTITSTETPDRTIPPGEVNRPIIDGAFTIKYIVNGSPNGPSSGLTAMDSTTGKTLWTVIGPQDQGPALFHPPLIGSGVIVAAIGGRNALNRGPASAIEFIDEATGATLWSAPGDVAVAIGSGLAYVLSGGNLEAHDIRTGEMRWSQPSDKVQVSANDRIVVSSDATGTVALDPSGNVLWTAPVGVDSSDVLARGGLLVGLESVFLVTSNGQYSHHAAASC